MDDFMGPVDNSGETQMMISTLSQIKTVSAQDFARAKASLDEVFGAVQEPLQLLRSRSLAHALVWDLCSELPSKKIGRWCFGVLC